MAGEDHPSQQSDALAFGLWWEVQLAAGDRSFLAWALRVYRCPGRLPALLPH